MRHLMTQILSHRLTHQLLCPSLIQDEDLSLTLPQLLATTRGNFTVACELLALVRARAEGSCRCCICSAYCAPLARHVQ